MNKKVLNSTLQQQSSLHGEKRLFEIYNDKFIKITTNTVLKKQSFHVNLSMLAPWPVQHKNTAWFWLLMTVFCSIATSTAIFYFPQNIQIQNLFPLFIFLSLTTLFVFLYRSQNSIEFKSRYGNCVVFSLFMNKPNKNKLKNFIAEIKLRSLTASQEMKMDIKEMLAIETNELQRLRSENIISNLDYKKANKRIQQVKL